MPNIFAGTEPPRWLTDIAKPIDSALLGQTAGMALAGGWLSASEGKPFSEGLAEARLNQQDPLWKLKAAQTQAQTKNAIAQYESKWRDIQFQDRDTSAWMNEDLPALSKFREEFKTNPDAVPPVMTSTQGINAARQIEAIQLQRQRMEIQKENARSTLEKQKYARSFDDFVSALTPTNRAKIRALPNGGFIDQNRTEPSQAAIDAANEAAALENKPAFGTPASVQAAKVRTEGTKEVHAQDAENRAALQAQKDQAAMDREKVRLQGPYGEMETGEINGQKYVKWGKQWKWFGDDQKKARVNILTDKIKKLQDTITQRGKDPDLQKQLDAAWKEMDAEFAKGSQFPPLPKGKPSTPKVISITPAGQ